MTARDARPDPAGARLGGARVPPPCAGHFIGPYLAHYLDDLMADMGLRRWRTGNVYAEYLTPLTPDRYRGVAAERRIRRGDRRDGLLVEPTSSS